MTIDLQQLPHVFHARSLRRSVHARIATAFNALDQALEGGWPTPALIEVLTDVYGIGELQLLLPLLRQLTHAGPQPSLIVWLNPPHVPNGVALAQQRVDARQWVAAELAQRDLLWSCEQALRSQACSAVLAWITSPSPAAFRRLKLAAMSADRVGIVFRRLSDARQPSPASLRLVLRPQGDQLSIEIIKNEGRMPRQVVIDVRAAANEGSPA
jgi:cell division inhibitor SulA/protein ImuA